MRATLLAALLLCAPAAFAGSCWTGGLPDGSTRHSKCYASQFDHILRGTPTLSKDDPGATSYRSVWRRIDADAFEVRRETPGGDGWNTGFSVVHRRAGAAP
ncbi:MAG: hypothetical protein WBO04_06790 [Steroidobacteraceae bacterium]